jgi:hypothetical protein
MIHPEKQSILQLLSIKQMSILADIISVFILFPEAIGRGTEVLMFVASDSGCCQKGVFDAGF